MERWMICDSGHVHWGAHGVSGLLLKFTPPDGEPCYLLQQRTRWVDHPGSWGIPGGAIREGESPQPAAFREAEEEIDPIPRYRVTGVDAQDCGGGWRFYTVCADVDGCVFCILCTRDRCNWMVHSGTDAHSALASRLAEVVRRTCLIDFS